MQRVLIPLVSFLFSFCFKDGDSAFGVWNFRIDEHHIIPRPSMRGGTPSWEGGEGGR